MNEIAKHKAAIEDAETQNKVGTTCAPSTPEFSYLRNCLRNSS